MRVITPQKKEKKKKKKKKKCGVFYNAGLFLQVYFSR
jgi:hypothetical protein